VSIARRNRAVYLDAMSDTAAPAGRWIDIANPTRFIALADRIVPWLGGLAAIALGIGLWMAFAAPEDYQQGITVRIMYMHVPSAWLGMMCYVGHGDFGASAFWCGVIRSPTSRSRPRPRSGPPSRFLALATGSLWGKPMWGTWWVWDARLTSFLDPVPDVSRHHGADLARSRSRRGAHAKACDRDAGRLRSTFRSSSSRSTGGTLCTSRPPSSVSTSPTIHPPCSRRCSSARSGSRCCS
jgi:hypothetical protein